MLLQAAIQERINDVCPNQGMSFGKLDDKKTWVVRFDEKATAEERQAAQAIIDKFQWDDVEKKKAEIKELSEKYKDDLLYRKAFSDYKQQIPSATFRDFIIYLLSIEI